MPSALTEALKLLGFTTPFIYALSTYRIFIHFDKRGVSAKAKRAISDWLQPHKYDRAAVGDAILEIFNFIYSNHLFSLTALKRSACITIVVSFIFYFEMNGFGDFTTKYLLFWSYIRIIAEEFIPPLLTNIMSDYIALFVVKRYIILGKTNTIKALLLGPLAGMLIVIIFLIIRFLIIVLWAAFLEPTSDHLARFHTYITSDWATIYTLDRPFSLAALIVHLWLPFFGVCVAVLKILNYFRIAVGSVQLFLSRGSEHPLEAIGYVAATIVLATTIAAQHIF
jgi:hypothetical protein